MAHNICKNDSMISVGQRPWHGLGVVLDTPPASAAEALRLAKLDWTVSKRDLFLGDQRKVILAGSVSRKNDGAPGAIVRDDTNDILGVVGPCYQPLQNADMSELFEPLIAEGILTIETCGSLFSGRRVWMLGKLCNGSAQITGPDDTVNRYLMLSHGHDGSMAVRFGFTFIRVVCWNTLSLAHSQHSSKLVKCLHTSSLKTNLEALRKALSVGDEVFELTAEAYRKLARSGVSRASLREYARIIVGAKEDSAHWTGQQRDKIGRIVGMALEGKGNRGQTWWDAYNGATEYLTWSAGRNKHNRFNSLWFGSAANTNRDALDLALEMAS